MICWRGVTPIGWGHRHPWEVLHVGGLCQLLNPDFAETVDTVGENPPGRVRSSSLEAVPWGGTNSALTIDRVDLVRERRALYARPLGHAADSAESSEAGRDIGPEAIHISEGIGGDIERWILDQRGKIHGPVEAGGVI